MPAGLSFVTKASSPGLSVVSKAPDVVGKSVELVEPATKALPDESTAMPKPTSVRLPPR